VAGKLGEERFPLQYAAIMLTSAFILAMAFLVPYFASSLNATRLYHITLLVLAPLCVLGFDVLSGGIRGVVRKLHPVRLKTRFSPKLSGCLVLVVLIPYFLFTTGFVFAIANDAPYSFALALNRMDGPYYGELEASGVKWVLSVSNNQTMYGDAWEYWAIYGTTVLADPHMQVERAQYLPVDARDIQGHSFILLRSQNLMHDEVLILDMTQVHRTRYVNLQMYLNVSTANQIYDNGGSEVLN
jgi:uncharacterized membrane protein